MFAYKVVVTTLVVLLMLIIISASGKIKTKNERNVYLIFIVAYVATLVGMWL